MPNYVTSKCWITGAAEEIERFRATAIRTAPADHSDAGGPLFDFEMVVPTPPAIEATYNEKSSAGIGVALVLAAGDSLAPFSNLGLYERDIAYIRRVAGLDADAGISNVARVFLAKEPEVAAMGRNRLRAVVETGYTHWYPWNIANWGTKWNSFRFRDLNAADGYAFQFETAWSFPTPIFEKIAADFPLLAFECATFDEGSNFAGEGWFNPPDGKQPFMIGDATDALHERVYGYPPSVDEDDDEQ